MIRILLIFLLLFPSIAFTLDSNKSSKTVTTNKSTEIAIVAGGCFWCVQSDFDKLDGVKETIVGYDGGFDKSITYEKVSSGKTPFVESIKIIYDPNKLSYSQLLDFFWVHIDPTNIDGQFCDRGKQYRTVIFYLNESQKKIAIASKEKIQKKFKGVYTEIVPSTHFVNAEEYHQKYYLKNPIQYTNYRNTCRRDARVKELWDAK
ncbi:peptide-methionine (S)-S-oxide reductase MsrA [Fluviispira vulneris]|uniref:peptide-methionine (S)-S-oxide reductase MsrA n=1 Tax=Fluviispira vulneris TaxID=2763012 RepID=UPI001644FF53|nr:peptide-methionine (S)-S-oxide reductase MsrA [Fluviispira vulneris]